MRLQLPQARLYSEVATRPRQRTLFIHKLYSLRIIKSLYGEEDVYYVPQELFRGFRLGCEAYFVYVPTVAKLHHTGTPLDFDFDFIQLFQ